MTDAIKLFFLNYENGLIKPEQQENHIVKKMMKICAV
jgi:hypothetical protein